MPKTLPQLYAQRFIARPDVIAVQSKDGSKWAPDRGRKFTVPLLEEHIAGSATYGHYLVNKDNQCKLFAFDCDLNTVGAWVKQPSEEDLVGLLDRFPDPGPEQDAAFDHLTEIYKGNPRELWQDKGHPSRKYFLRQMRTLAEMLSSRIHKELDIPVACAYSGHKGFHVYGFHGLLDAGESRALAQAVLDSFDRFSPIRGDNYFVDQNPDPADGFSNWVIELFPKKEIHEGDDLGFLMRLPLGRNRKAAENKTFFFDQRLNHHSIKPHPDPIALLETGNPWQ